MWNVVTHLRVVRPDDRLPDPECAYCLDVGRHVRAAYGNVLCVDGEKYDLCADHYRMYAKAVNP